MDLNDGLDGLIDKADSHSHSHSHSRSYSYSRSAATHLRVTSNLT